MPINDYLIDYNQSSPTSTWDTSPDTAKRNFDRSTQTAKQNKTEQSESLTSFTCGQGHASVTEIETMSGCWSNHTRDDGVLNDQGARITVCEEDVIVRPFSKTPRAMSPSTSLDTMSMRHTGASDGSY
jgi:hypothetical protein